jgi:class 3 adenylate cyclase
VTNLAARIAAAASKGDILVGPETAKRVKEKIPLYDRGMMHFKNIRGEVRIYSPLRRL